MPVSSKHAVELPPASVVSNDLGPEIDIPTILQPASPRFWQTKPVLFVYENGFRLEKGSRSIQVLFKDIEEMTWQESDRFVNGILSGTEHKIKLRTAAQTFRIRHYGALDSSDNFSTLTKSLVTWLANEAQDRLNRNVNLKGQNWIVSTEGLAFENLFVRWEEVSDIDVIDGFLNIWRKKEDYPVGRVPMSSAQAHVLFELLSRYLRDQPAKQAIDSLGHFLLRREPHRSLRFVVAGLAVAVAVLGIWLFLQAANGVLPGIACLSLAGIGGGYALYFLRRAYEFHENGVVIRPGYRVLFFKDCESMQYQVSLQYINGVYAFTRIILRLRTSSADVSIRVQCYGNDQELEQIKTNLARRISERLYLKVCTGIDVTWGSSVTLSKDEIYFLSSRLLGGATRLSVSFSAPLAYTMDSGQFSLFRTGDTVPLFSMDCGDVNFYPGFFLMLRLVEEHRTPE